MLNGLPGWLAARRPWQRFALAFLLGALATAVLMFAYATVMLTATSTGKYGKHVLPLFTG